jgi:ubiquinone/menaquinone biosynthesis C-methylase UbiE
MFDIVHMFAKEAGMLNNKNELRTHPMETGERKYLPAAGRDRFLPLYDPFVKLFRGDRARKRLIEKATIQSNDRVLEIGCGTGTLILMIKELHPTVNAFGLDPDPKALNRAKRKSQKAGVEVQLDQGFSDALPYPNESFDLVFSSFMFHHLSKDEKLKTLVEVHRVLKPDGYLFLLDFDGPQPKDSGLSRWIHSRHRLEDNSESKIHALLQEAGFSSPQTIDHGRFLLFRTAYYRNLR